MTSELLWYTSRVTGIAAIVLLTAVLIIGTLLSGRRHGAVTNTVKMALHRWLSLGQSVFLVVHIVTAVAEGFVKLPWIALVVPFTSGWEPLWVGLGTLAVDLLIATLLTSWLRPWLPERVWRPLHRATYALWPLAIAHGFALGTANEPVLRGITIACAGLGAGAIGLRSLSRVADRDRRLDVLAQEWS